MIQLHTPSCSMLPRFFAAAPPASTPDTLLMVDMLLAALCSGLPEPGAVWAGSVCGTKSYGQSGVTVCADIITLDVLQRSCHLHCNALPMAARRGMQQHGRPYTTHTSLLQPQ